MWNIQIKCRTCAKYSTSSLAEPHLVIAREYIFNNRRGFTGLLDVYNNYEDAGSESVKEPDNKETTQPQPALNTSTGLVIIS